MCAQPTQTENTFSTVDTHCGSLVLMHKCINVCVAAFVYNDSYQYATVCYITLNDVGGRCALSLHLLLSVSPSLTRPLTLTLSERVIYTGCVSLSLSLFSPSLSLLLSFCQLPVDTVVASTSVYVCVCVCVDSGSVWGYIGSMARCRSGGRELLLCQRFPPLAPLFKTTLCVSAYSMCGIGTFSVTVLL